MAQAADGVDPELIRIWLTGWTLTRGTPPPVQYGDGFRVEVGWPDQRARLVFPALTPALAQSAAAIREPLIFLKVCAASAALAEVIGDPWRLQEGRVFMRTDSDMPDRPLPEGYRLDLLDQGPTSVARVTARDGQVVSQGGLACVGGFAIFDRIVTQPAHRRLGLAAAIMSRLGQVARGAGVSRGLLVATAEGRLLYEALGWSVRSPYASAVIPA